MIVARISCDICGIAKGEENHWLIAVTWPDMLGILFGPARMTPPGENAKVEHLCGEACAHVRLSRAIAPSATPHPPTDPEAA